MRSLRIIVLPLLALAAACASEKPRAASEDPGIRTPTTSSSSGELDLDDDDATEGDASVSDAGLDALDAADAFDGYYPPPPSKCNPEMTLGSAQSPLGDSSARTRFAGISRDELTIAWNTPGEAGKTSLFVAERDTTSEAFGTPTLLSADAATDGVAITDDGLALYATSPDHRSFIVYERPDRDTDFAVGDDSIFDPLIQALDPEELVGDPVFVNSGLVFLHSQYGKSADTMRLANRISIYASFNPGFTLAFDAFRANGTQRRRPTGTGDDFQVLFFWDEVSGTEKLARLNGTEYVLGVKDLGAAPWATPNASCNRVYFGDTDVFAASAQ